MLAHRIQELKTRHMIMLKYVKIKHKTYHKKKEEKHFKSFAIFNCVQVRPTEHPYAQLNAPSTSQTTNAQLTSSHVDITAQSTSIQATALNEQQQHQQRSSHHSDNSQNHSESPAPQVEIPAASAIAGMISASQDLPYMTPPIANQHFSGDSQDSSSKKMLSIYTEMHYILHS